MPRRLSTLVMLVVLVLLSLVPALHAFTPLKDGDRVVFYGDSITQQQLYTRYLQQYVLCRYPELDVRFYNAGWSGDRAPGALKRLDRDVLSLNPTVVTLFFGMNDGGYKKLEDATVNTYRTAMEGIITALKGKGVRVIVYGPGCVDYDKRPPLREADYNATLAALSKAAGELAQEHGCEYVDVHAAMLEFQTAQKAKDPSFTMIPDAVHPDAKGHLVMARAMLEPFAEPMETIEAPAAVASGGESTAISFDVPSGLPFWIDPGSMRVAEESGMLAFAAPKLAVQGLPAGAYQVSVNGQGDQQATADELAAGVPLVANTPRAKRLHDLVARKESLYFTSWREIRVDLAEEPKSAAAADALLAADEPVQALIRDYARPAPLTIAINPKPEGENLALKKKYETSDPNTHNWGIGGLTDGSWEAGSRTCFATNESPTFPKTATIDLEQPAPVSTVVLGVPPFGSTKTIEVSLSADGTSFTRVGRHEFPQRKEARHTFSFAPQTARYVRLTYPDNHREQVDYDPRFAFTTEVEVYARRAGGTP